MSEVKIFWKTVSAKFGVSRSLHQLNQMEQMQVIPGINMIMGVLKQ